MTRARRMKATEYSTTHTQLDALKISWNTNNGLIRNLITPKQISIGKQHQPFRPRHRSPVLFGRRQSSSSLARPRYDLAAAVSISLADRIFPPRPYMAVSCCNLPFRSSSPCSHFMTMLCSSPAGSLARLHNQ